MQTRTQSMLEAIANVGVGFGISFAVGAVLYPMWGMPVTFLDNLGLTACFTVTSIARSYVVRRWFNGLRFRSKP